MLIGLMYYDYGWTIIQNIQNICCIISFEEKTNKKQQQIIIMIMKTKNQFYYFILISKLDFTILWSLSDTEIIN